MRTAVRHASRKVSAGLILCLACTGAFASACVVTPAQLQAATNRAFQAGQPATAVDGSALCHYAQQDQPARKLTVSVSTGDVRRAFESRMRLLKMGSASIELNGVGDAAYYNGTAAGVLAGERLITITNLRRASDPKIPAERVAELLKLALATH